MLTAPCGEKLHSSKVHMRGNLLGLSSNFSWYSWAKALQFSCLLSTLLVRPERSKGAFSISCENIAKSCVIHAHNGYNCSQQRVCPPELSFRSATAFPRRLLAFHYPHWKSCYRDRDTFFYQKIIVHLYDGRIQYLVKNIFVELSYRAHTPLRALNERSTGRYSWLLGYLQLSCFGFRRELFWQYKMPY